MLKLRCLRNHEKVVKIYEHICFSILSWLGAGKIGGKGISCVDVSFGLDVSCVDISCVDVSCVDVSLVDRSVVIKIVYKHTRTEPRMIVFELFRQYFLVLSTTEFVSISVGCEKCHLTYDQMPEIHASHKLVIFCIKLIVHLYTNPRLLILIRN